LFVELLSKEIFLKQDYVTNICVLDICAIS